MGGLCRGAVAESRLALLVQHGLIGRRAGDKFLVVEYLPVVPAMIQVDHGIPIPPKTPRGRVPGMSGNHKYPWRSLGIGDSFRFPFSMHSASRTICDRRKYDRAKYEARHAMENGERIVRIWRTA